MMEDESSNGERPPTYNEVIAGETREESIRRFAFLSGRTFVNLNVIMTIVFIVIFILFNLTNMFPLYMVDVSKYCNIPEYSKNATPQTLGVFEYILMGLSFALCISITIIKSYIDTVNAKETIKMISWDIWIIAMHIIFLSIVIHCIKLSCGSPRPYFFSSDVTKYYYCNTNESNSSTTIAPYIAKDEEKNLRTSFPSFRSAIYGFCLTFLYLYVDHIDVNIGLHATQQVIIVTIGSEISSEIFSLWERGENHPIDVLIGLLIGIMEGIMLIRGLLGSVLRR